MGRVVPPSPLPLSLFLDFPPTLCDKNQKLPKNHQKFAYLKKIRTFVAEKYVFNDTKHKNINRIPCLSC